MKKFLAVFAITLSVLASADVFACSGEPVLLSNGTVLRPDSITSENGQSVSIQEAKNGPQIYILTDRSGRKALSVTMSIVPPRTARFVVKSFKDNTTVIYEGTFGLRANCGLEQVQR